MNKEQQEKLAQVLLEESLTCADRNNQIKQFDDAKDLMQRSVAEMIKWNLHTIEKILNGDKQHL